MPMEITITPTAVFVAFASIGILLSLIVGLLRRKRGNS